MKKFVQYLPFFVALIFWVTFRSFFFHQVGDDSFIYFRYVERALAGHWWSWSDHVPAVEGYSSPLWYVLLIASGRAGLAVQSAAQWWGTFFSFMTLLGLWRLARLLNVSAFLSGVACFLLSINYGMGYWGSSGLETSMYAALLVWACIGIIRERFWLLPVSLIGIARPEGMFLLPAILLAMWIVKREVFPLKHLFACLIPTLLWLLLRLFVYHDLLPNTFYAKATGGLFSQIERGVFYCLPVLLPLLIFWGIWWKHRHSSLMIVLGMISMLMGIVLLGGGDWMFHFRLLVPMYALVFAVYVTQWSMVKIPGRLLLVMTVVPLLLLSVPLSYWGPAFKGKALPVLDYQEGNMTHMSMVLGRVIEERYPPHTLVAVNHAGALPWVLPDFDFIDMTGLNDGHIARQKGSLHHKYDVDYVLASKPELIVLNTRVRPGTDDIWYHKGYWAGEDALVDNPEFVRDYTPTDLVAGWHWHVPELYLYLFSQLLKNAESSWIVVYQRRH